MKILKYTFKKDAWGVDENNEPIIETKEYTAHFSLTTRGMGEFEVLTGESLMGTLSEFENVKTNEDMLKALDSQFVGALASVCYFDTKNMNNVSASAQNFMESEMYDCAITDYIFIAQLIQMAIDCMSTGEKPKKQRGSTKSKK